MASDRAVGPLFVVGMWRSGTSLLYALLNQHPQIALMYEGELPNLWPLFWVPGLRSSWPVRLEVWNSAFTRHQIDVGSIPTGLIHVKTASEALYQEYARQRGATIWGEKSPSYLDSLISIARTFPNARFIAIWRDPAGICGSVIRAASSGSYFARRGMPLRALLGVHRMKVECDELRAKGTPVHHIQYEELIRDPASRMMEVCKFLGIPFDPGMASLKGADRSALYGGDHHALVKGNNIVSSSERAEVLSPKFKRKIERYTLFWKQRYGGEWPAFPRSAGNQAGKPNLVERLVDRALYRLLRGMDLATCLTYCFAPLGLLKARKDNTARNEAKAEQQQVVRPPQKV